MMYDPKNWFWRSDDGRIFSSASQAVVPADDAALTAWIEAGGMPTAWPADEHGDQSDAALQWVFDNAGAAVFLGLSALKVGLKAAVDAAAEVERLKYITPGAGQAMTYSRKVEEARAAQSADEPEPEDYPLLAASIGIDGEDIEAVAATVLAMDAAWAQTGGAIERARLLAKRDIDQAEDESSARAVTPDWP